METQRGFPQKILEGIFRREEEEEENIGVGYATQNELKTEEVCFYYKIMCGDDF